MVELPSISLWRLGLLRIEKIFAGEALMTIRAALTLELPVSIISDRTWGVSI